MTVLRAVWRAIKYGSFGMLGLCGVVLLWLQMTMPNLNNLPTLQNGDLVFQTIRSHQTTAVMLASYTVYTHVGMIKLTTGGGLLVVEAVGPVREVPLDKWIQHGIGQRITIKRLPNITKEQAQSVLESARADYGKPYDPFFLFDTQRIYCSELVYAAYQAGAHISLGKIQKVAELDTDNFAVHKLLQERWQQHPLCQTPQTQSFAACLPVIKQQDIITPLSVASDNRLVTLYDNYGWLN